MESIVESWRATGERSKDTWNVRLTLSRVEGRERVLIVALAIDVYERMKNEVIHNIERDMIFN